MKANLEEITPVKKKLYVELEPNEVDRELKKAYAELGKNARIPGFRPGKIPRKILETRFGDQVENDVTQSLIRETLPRAMEELDSFPLGAPLLEKGSLKQGQTFNYSAILEVRPSFDLKDYLGVEAPKERIDIPEDKVSEQLEKIREAHGRLEALNEERPIQDGDYAIIEYKAYHEGEPIERVGSSNFLVKVGGGSFYPDVEKSLIGLNKGDEKDVRVRFEEDCPDGNLAGKDVNFRVKVFEVKEMIRPELDDAFVKGLGDEFTDVEDFKKKVEESIRRQEEKRIERELRQSILQTISEGVDFELPEVMVEAEIAEALERVKQNLSSRGTTLEDAGLSEEKMRNEFREPARKRVKDTLILAKIAEKEKLIVVEEDVRKGFEDLAAATGQEADSLRKYYEARNLLGTFKENLLEEKTLNYLVENASIKELDKRELDKT